MADYVLDNGGDLAHLEGEVERLWPGWAPGRPHGPRLIDADGGCDPVSCYR